MTAGTDVWGLGDYERVAVRLAPAAEALVQAADVADGTRVLDVAAGTGNVAIAAARRGARVTATDLSPAMVERGRARTADLGVDWSEANAERLPFADGAFDSALSCFGAMFAGDQQAAADELLRVVRPGGVAAMTAWVPEGTQFAITSVLPRHVPNAPTLMNAWGEEHFARERFAAADELRVERHHLTWNFADHADWLAFMERGPGPMVAAQRALGDRWPAVRAEMLALLPPDGAPFTLEPPYLLIVARRQRAAV